MTEPEDIFASLPASCSARAAGSQGRRVLVSAGGTREPLDAVRFVGNRSSGRMGVALAEEARRRGAERHAARREPRRAGPAGVEVVQTPTGARSSRARRRRAPDATSSLMAAAVADYGPRARPGKRPKDADTWTLELEPTKDVTPALGGAPRERPGARRASAPSTGSRGSSASARKLSASAPTSSSSTTSRGTTSASTPRTTRSCSSRRRRATVAQGAEGALAAAILDEVEAAALRARFAMNHATSIYDFPARPTDWREGMAAQATVALEKAKRREPDKASIREALGIAYFRIRRWGEAEAEFRALLELSPVDDYAHYALGRALEKQGREPRRTATTSSRARSGPSEQYRARIRELE